MKIHYATISETGKRQNNEDAFRIVNRDARKSVKNNLTI